ncbi:MAG: FAD-binding oxidoreductase [Chloracidobacterium sp.]|nr:FAD-binding oxidoreductase [Chloracidobacterium sp.]
MKNAETVIIGGGVSGTSIAYHLAERGMNGIVILEREKMLGLGSTGKATGGVRAQFETDINIKLSLYSLDFFRNWEFDCEYEPRGYIFLATEQRHIDYLKRTGERQRELGYKEVEIVDVRTISKLVPGLNCEDILGGSFGPADGFINPLSVLEGFSTGAALLGTRVISGTTVRSIEVEGGRVTGVHTSNGLLECDNVVLCAGAWSQHIAATAGIELPVEPQRRQIVWARAPQPLPNDLPMVIDLADGFHFRPARDFVFKGSDAETSVFANHDVLFAYPDPDEPASFSTDFDEGFLDKVGERASHRAPFLNGAKIIYEKCRAGLYENTPDHHAILGGCGVEGLYFAAGFSGHGVMHSPATGKALAEIILDGEASFMDVSCLSLDRFTKGELLHETAFI